MDLFPAIDVRGGRVVRLLRGDYDAETAYDVDPIARARSFADAGARWVHVVDLDAARSGELTNQAVIRAIAAELSPRGVGVQVGGGIRSAETAGTLLDAGVARVVLGTAAVESPELVDALVAEHPGAVAVGLDARGTEVAVRGWTEGTGENVVDLAAHFDGRGVAALVVTSIDRDGTLEGPDVPLLEEVLAGVTTDVIASGGVGSVADLRALAAVRTAGRALAGAIVGRALYDGRFRLEEGLEACSPSA